ncbi:hypothetical protein EDEG_02843 [Edhazardia aedis USNM 41457]|uniref:Guanylate cyclase domain-containing protein n=1 Tax=Edhazardia aedis (strain USNM 41457) TaxID=1003232 RepID=J9DJF8_EDHAE|nr:hypothetical protein EDEG_02843 [Edhazardia aedis USNM 41457]|eukprot:EJW02750.1 hypothetical protein EDEG_02843 [Edhazardia aedis USNM 41457]
MNRNLKSTKCLNVLNYFRKFEVICFFNRKIVKPCMQMPIYTISCILKLVTFIYSQCYNYEKVETDEPVFTSINEYLYSKEQHERVFYFVLTDIVDSTKKWCENGVYMHYEMLWHAKMGEKLILKHDGYIINREGDSFFVAFLDKSSAVNFATEYYKKINERRKNNNNSPLSLQARIAVSEAFCVAFLDQYRYSFLGDEIDNIAGFCNNINRAGMIIA